MKYLIFLILIYPFNLSSQVTTDTLWSVPELDGGIDYRPGSGIFTMSTTSGGFYPGDGFDIFLQEEGFTREYLSFNISNLTFYNADSINNIILWLYQHDEIGNDQLGVYPIWNVAGGDTHFCVLDHVNYGNSLDLSDWTAGNLGDPQTLKSNIGKISSDTITGYHTLDVTEFVKNDIDSARTYNQYRMRFTIDTDQDNLGDKLIFISGDSPLYKPFLVISYGLSHIYDKPDVRPIFFKLMQNFPNPFNPITNISYSITKSGNVKLIVFDVLGKRVQTLVNNKQRPGNHSVNFDGTVLPSGLYYYKIIFNNQSLTKKMVLVR